MAYVYTCVKISHISQGSPVIEFSWWPCLSIPSTSAPAPRSPCDSSSTSLSTSGHTAPSAEVFSPSLSAMPHITQDGPHCLVFHNLPTFPSFWVLWAPLAVITFVFPVVMYGCESWTVKKLNAKELMLLNCGVGEDSWESLRLQGDQTSQS